MYSKIRNPKTLRMVSVNGKIGRKILKNYIRTLVGGGFMVGGDGSVEKKYPVIFVTADWCGHCVAAKERFTAAKAQLRAMGYTVYSLQNTRGQGNMLDTTDKENPKQMSKEDIENYFSQGRGFPSILKQNGTEFKQFSEWQKRNGVVRDEENIVKWGETPWHES